MDIELFLVVTTTSSPLSIVFLERELHLLQVKFSCAPSKWARATGSWHRLLPSFAMKLGFLKWGQASSHIQTCTDAETLMYLYTQAHGTVTCATASIGAVPVPQRASEPRRQTGAQGDLNPHGKLRTRVLGQRWSHNGRHCDRYRREPPCSEKDPSWPRRGGRCTNAQGESAEKMGRSDQEGGEG